MQQPNEKSQDVYPTKLMCYHISSFKLLSEGYMFRSLLITILLVWSVSAVAAPDKDTKNAFKQFYNNLTNLELEIAGTGYGHIRVDIPGDEGVEYWCFGGIPMYDKKSRLLVGYANDCLSGVIDDNGTVTVNPGFTFFDFFAPDGDVFTLMVSGNITVQAAAVPTQTAWGLDVTHITGSSVADKRDNNTCVGGSGPFDEARCVSRISGMVDMSNINPQDIPNSTLKFSCYFSVEGLKLKKWAVRSAAEQL